MSTTTFARPYAKAVFSYALSSQTLSAWSDLLAHYVKLMANQQLVAIINNPRVTAQQITSLLLDLGQSVLTSIPQHAGDNFIRLLISNKRIIVLPAIQKLFERYRLTQQREIKVTITSAQPLSDEHRDKCLVSLRQRLQCEVILRQQVDATLIGGAMIKIDDLIIDGSIKGKLAKLQHDLTI